MKRLRLAAWAALAGLGLLSGCQSCDPCGGRPGVLGRLGLRPRGQVIHEGPVSSYPVSGYPVTSELPYTLNGGGCCDGPMLPPVSSPPLISPAPVYNGGPYLDSPPAIHGGAMNALPPGAFRNPGEPPLTMPPAGVLPHPSPVPGVEPRLNPVPNGGLAQPTPATPSARRRAW